MRVLAPAGVLRISTLSPAREILKAAGIPTTMGAGLESVDPDAPYLAGTDVHRAKELMEAFADPTVGGVICARGGYGTMRLLKLLDPHVFRQNPKPLVGFSDITALCAFLASQSGLSSFHGPLLSTLAMHGSDPLGSVQAMVRALRGRDEKIVIGGLKAARGGGAKGHLLGGNLTIVAALNKSGFFPPMSGALLFLEEVGESAYKVDRLLTQLALQGVFEEVAGVILGDMGGTGDQYVDGTTFSEVVQTRVLDLCECPVVTGLPVGHGVSNLTLPYGRGAVLSCEGAEATLSVSMKG